MSYATTRLDPAALLARHPPHDLSRTVPARTRATLGLDVVGRGRWTVHVDHGVVTLTEGLDPRPSCSLRTDARTLEELLLPALTMAPTRNFLHPSRRPRSAADVLQSFEETL